jgi:hypothetical protein
MYVERDLVGIITGVLGEPTSTSKNPPSISGNENVVGCLISISC